MMCPFIEYYMLSQDPYMEFRYAGTNQINFDLIDINIKRFQLQIEKGEYKNYLTGKQQILNEVMELVEKAFERWYGFKCKDIFLNNNYQENFNSYVYVDTVNPVFIHIDQLLESIIFSFMLTTLKWAKELEKHEMEDDNYFMYLLFLMNNFCILGQLPTENEKALIMEKVVGDQQIINLAADCHWSIMTFTIAHEVAHVYQVHTDIDYWSKHPKEAELNADEIAYDIVLRLIMEKKERNLMLEKYTYLAPMMYMDFFDLYYYTCDILYETIYDSETHPTPKVRKDALFTIVDSEIYQIDTEEGNVVYQHFCLIYDIFLEKLVKYKESGMLDTIINNELRKRE